MKFLIHTASLLCCLSASVAFNTQHTIQKLHFQPTKKHVLFSPSRSCAPRSMLRMSSVDDENEVVDYDPVFSGGTTIGLIGGQSLLIIIAVIAASFLDVPNFGLGEQFVLNDESITSGVEATLPLFALAFILDFAEQSVPALQEVSKATQRSVLGLMGGARKPILALGVSVALGAAAGLGEEMLFRGVAQYELNEVFGDFIALTSSALIFGLLHAVTPLYAALAGLASLYFGGLYLTYDNLAVPIVCHGLYDVGALMAAHFAVSGMSVEERIELANWEPSK